MADEKTKELIEQINSLQNTNNTLKKEALELEQKVAKALGDQRDIRFS